MFGHRETCYCAFCRSPKKVHTTKSLRFHHVILSAVTAMIMVYFVKREIHPAGFVVFVLLMLICEFFLKIRWRMGIVCRHCGFDPVLYMKDLDKTVDQVKNHLDKRRQSSTYLMTRPLNLPVITAEKAQALADAKSVIRTGTGVDSAKAPDKTGRLVNRQI